MSIEGSGVEETVIRSATSGTAVTLYINGGYTTLTRLAVQDFSGSGTGAYAIEVDNSGVILDRAEAYAEGSAIYQIGIYANSSSVEMYNEALAAAFGGTAFGIYTAGNLNYLIVHHALVDAGSNTIYNAAADSMYMADDGVYDSPLANFGAGVYKCIGNYNRNESLVGCP